MTLGGASAIPGRACCKSFPAPTSTSTARRGCARHRGPIAQRRNTAHDQHGALNHPGVSAPRMLPTTKGRLMSTLEAAPAEVECSANRVAGIEVLHPREVPLGGPRAIRVRRTLPQRQRSLIGAWCFIDHYGPVSASMDVPPHPHTGLQTVSWLFGGEVEHRDSAGVHAAVRPGELNLMTAGAGICHSEVSTPATRLLHGVQLWIALPESDRDTARGFDHYVPQAVPIAGATLRVFLGDLEGACSPV